jgi:predicted dehydrogenase
LEQAGVSFHHGDLSRALRTVEPTHVIVAAPVERLVDISVMVMAAGVRHLLIEKPGLMTRAQGKALSEASKGADARGGSRQ